MGCALGVLALVTPRFVLVVLWAFSDYLTSAFGSFLWPLLGFLFLPTTTLAYAVARNEFGGVRGIGVVLVALGALLDLGVIGGGARGRRRRGA